MPITGAGRGIGRHMISAEGGVIVNISATTTTSEETVSFIKLLASESTSFVTGQIIMFDGERNMR